MKKGIIGLLTAVFLTTFLAGCAGGEKIAAGGLREDGTYYWRFAHEENNGSIQDVYVKRFVEKLSEKSDGKIQVDIYPVGQIGDATQQAELLQNGALDLAMVSPGNTGTLVPENQIFSLHFLFPDDMEKTQAVLSDSKALNELLSARYMEKNIKVLDYWTQGTMEWTTEKKVSTPGDWKGLKMRTMPSPMIVASYEAYGANPTPMPYMEVYSGLQLKMIQGQENPISAIEEMKFYEVQDYLTQAAASLYITTTSVNPQFYEALPEDIRAILDETVEEMHEESFDIQEDLNGGALAKIQEVSDIEVVKLTQEERQLFRDASQSAYKKYVEFTGESGKEILELLQAEVAQYEAKP